MPTLSASSLWSMPCSLRKTRSLAPNRFRNSVDTSLGSDLARACHFYYSRFSLEVNMNRQHSGALIFLGLVFWVVLSVVVLFRVQIPKDFTFSENGLPAPGQFIRSGGR
jgi:hypothetical protein